ncbi:hypothetical protein FOL47_001503 [Perkinsus chesapeaki]|uniref:Uncharacterized protein n=1 Tax=Perkinsus chesapeaki TaxID=330153 RepID=A0A7J6MK04_PERCH|nr:hypothetical protein FOL47_001503 [Perkinsus chesapeaki]
MSNTDRQELSENCKSNAEEEDDEQFKRAMELVERRLRDLDADYEATLAAEKPKDSDPPEDLGYGLLRSESCSSSEDDGFGAFTSGEVLDEPADAQQSQPTVIHPKPMSSEKRERIKQAMAEMPKPPMPEWARALSDEEFLRAVLSDGGHRKGQ